MNEDELAAKRLSKGNGGMGKAVILGGRLYRLTIDREADHNLRVLANFRGVTPHEYATYLLQWSIKRAAWEMGTGLAITHFLTNRLCV